MPDDIARASAATVATREALLAAAVDELATGNPSGLTVRAVARRAGVSAATAYKVFSSKEHLLASVLLRHLRTAPPMEPTPGVPLETRLVAFTAAFVDRLRADPGLLAALRSTFLGDDPDTVRVRGLVVADVDARFDTLYGDDVPPDQRGVLRLAFAGLMVTAGAGLLDFAAVPAEMVRVLRTVLGRDQADSS